MVGQVLDTRTMDCQVADRLWASYAQNRDPRLREEIIHQFERLAYSIANRYARRGAENEDICQVARMALVKAVDRFDPTTHYRFSTFATPTIVGEIKRYFRDHSRPVHVPRGIQELSMQVDRCTRDLSWRLGRTPTAAEIAEELGVAEPRVQEAMGLEEKAHPLSLDGENEGRESGESAGILEQTLGTEDAGLECMETQVSVRQLMCTLSEPLRRIIQLRYLSELTQREVARQLNLSQMQVCRMEKRALQELRSQLTVH